MHCTLCGLPPRDDDPMQTLWFGTQGMVTACRQCASLEADGIPMADPAYPVGQVPQVGDRDLHVCAICRRARRLNDPGTPIRLREDEVPPGHVYGCLIACSECLAAWTPVVRDRLRLERGIDVPQPTGDLLL